tara:strand:- start:3029 stop:4393 length:1365 start_codon:yes stop_codon:yes gene_type:complete
MLGVTKNNLPEFKKPSTIIHKNIGATPFNTQSVIKTEAFLSLGNKSELEDKLETEFNNINYHEEIHKIQTKWDKTNMQDKLLTDLEGYLSIGGLEDLDVIFEDPNENPNENINENENLNHKDEIQKRKINKSDSYTGLYQNYNKSFNKNCEHKSEAEVYNCHSCGGVDSIKSIQGVGICILCGIEKGPVVSEDLECQYSGMAVGDNSSKARTGMTNNNLLYESNFTTKIVGNHTSYSMKKINNVYDSLNYRERTLLKTFKKIADNCRQKGIPNNAINYSQVLYSMAYNKQKKLKKGNKGSRSDNLEGMIGGCIYYSCKGYNINRSHQEIAEVCNVDKSAVSYGCKLVFKLLNKEVDFNANRTNYNDFLDRYAYHLDLEKSELEIVRECCKNIYELGFLDHSKPSTIAAAAIYTCSNLYDFNLEKNEIAEKCHTTEPTLNKSYKMLLDHIDKIIV